jgi:hypothetical protein
MVLAPNAGSVEGVDHPDKTIRVVYLCPEQRYTPHGILMTRRRGRGQGSD